MSAFEDYCIVCEKLCHDGTAYCSNDCKILDQENILLEQTNSLSESPLLISDDFDSRNRLVNTNLNTHIVNSNNCSTISQLPNTISIVSPLLTPQVLPKRNSIVGSLKSPNLKDLTYESPLLATSNSTCSNLMLNDLDSNRLDLNLSTSNSFYTNTTPMSTSISERLSKSLAPHNELGSKRILTINNLINPTSSSSTTNSSATTKSNTASKKISNVANILHSSSENYKKWLSIH